MAGSTLAAWVARRALASPSATALTVPLEPLGGLTWTNDELAQRVMGAAGLLRELGFVRGDVVAHDLPNTHHNLVLQLAAMHLGVAVTTPKDSASLAAAAAKLPVKGAVLSPGSALAEQASQLPIPAMAVEAVLSALGPSSDPSGGEDLPAAYFNPTAGKFPVLSSGDLADLGRAAVDHLQLGEDDASCVSVSLSHSFGIGTGCGAALASGGAVVLPSAGGIRGCGDPAQRAEVTRDALLSSPGCTALFGDSHTIKALEPLGFPPVGHHRLRTGVIKVASGTDFLPERVEYGGVELHTMGRATDG